MEQAPEVALLAIRRDPHAFEFVENEWVRYACLDPNTHTGWIYLGGDMVALEGLASPAWAWPTSLDAAHQGRDNLPVGFIGGPAHAREAVGR
ncbi:MAG: hypothetical protein JOZ69_02135 [Myxococcales bacterium]|nr:hypothetical protein [Myxococcales bacterium]